MLRATANSATAPDAHAHGGADSDQSARSQSGVVPLLGLLAHRTMRTLNPDDAGPNPAASEANISRFAELVARAVVAGYRNPEDGQSLGDVSRRPLSIEALLDGRVLDEWTLWEVANQVHLPTTGKFVVVAAVGGQRSTAWYRIEAAQS
jgi:hypothetical protein